mmetsp:Transcript_24332/g.52451  ORF Transcript_24332/g.52451 Transcript_24332/m.52451 type:complete len:277 (+) Transcript_24332:4308-5138(+)
MWCRGMPQYNPVCPWVPLSRRGPVLRNLSSSFCPYTILRITPNTFIPCGSRYSVPLRRLCQMPSSPMSLLNIMVGRESVAIGSFWMLMRRSISSMVIPWMIIMRRSASRRPIHWHCLRRHWQQILPLLRPQRPIRIPVRKRSPKARSSGLNLLAIVVLSIWISASVVKAGRSCTNRKSNSGAINPKSGGRRRRSCFLKRWTSMVMIGLQFLKLWEHVRTSKSRIISMTTRRQLQGRRRKWPRPPARRRRLLLWLLSKQVKRQERRRKRSRERRRRK